MLEKYLPYAKAWAAFLGAIITAVLGVIPEGAVVDTLTIVSAVLTVVAVYAIPNKGNDETVEPEPVEEFTPEDPAFS